MAPKRKIPARSRVAKRRRFNMTNRGGLYKSYNPFRSSRIRGATLKVKRMVYAGQLAPAADLSTGTSYFWQYQSISLDKGIKQFNGTSTTLTGLTNLSEYQALFDQYKLGAYKVTFRPRMQNLNTDQSDTTGGLGGRPPRFCVLIDGKNAVTPSGTYSAATLNTLLEGGGKIRRGDVPFSVYVKPFITEQYGGGANRYVRPKFTDLNASAGSGMQHNGFHLFLFKDGFDSVNTNLAWDVFITYYLTFKNMK